LGTVSTQAWWTFVTYKSLSLVCVPLFVILTGALLLQPSKINEPIKVFLKKRLSRIGLAFLFWTFIYLVWGFFISHTPLTLYNVIQGSVISLFTGSYYHFWYIYLIAGLYLITPLLRAAIAYRDEKLIRYLIAVWFVGICIVPLLPLFTGYHLNGEIFIMGGYTGFFLIGAYL
jgi:surface polysaccharide O-acyltransferase-like enzyme